MKGLYTLIYMLKKKKKKKKLTSFYYYLNIKGFNF